MRRKEKSAGRDERWEERKGMWYRKKEKMGVYEAKGKEMQLRIEIKKEGEEMCGRNTGDGKKEKGM